MPEELNIESGSRTSRGLEAYKGFIEVYLLGRDPSEMDLLHIPQSSENAFLRMRSDISRETWELGRKAFQNMQKYGAPTWYEWHTQHWGTKWNAYGSSHDGNRLSFLTAWDAPHPVILKLSELLPGMEIHHEWADEDIGRNCGSRDYRDGEMTGQWYPTDQRESIEFAAEVMGADPSDYGLELSEDGTEYVPAEETEGMGGMQL